MLMGLFWSQATRIELGKKDGVKQQKLQGEQKRPVKDSWTDKACRERAKVYYCRPIVVIYIRLPVSHCSLGRRIQTTLSCRVNPQITQSVGAGSGCITAYPYLGSVGVVHSRYLRYTRTRTCNEKIGHEPKLLHC